MADVRMRRATFALARMGRRQAPQTGWANQRPDEVLVTIPVPKDTRDFARQGADAGSLVGRCDDPTLSHGPHGRTPYRTEWQLPP
ncbi:unnamed protein product [Dibothriocephalus latus]|uniref:Uncharacterized protein n=1 Tax=Dibothriocephalus latus TaxID=60516 RepID=A0A3P7NZQ5_DIBLA|nr:unnamed protein product [Dibothriocephalus latus]